MHSSPRNTRAPSTRARLARVVESYNPGVTLLVILWIGAFALRERLASRGALEAIADDALKSLLLVIPIMLVGWAVLVVVDRRYRLGLFGTRDEG